MRQQLRSLKGDPQEQKAKRKELRKKQHSELRDLRTWWLSRMLNSGAPLVKKMTLFWHGHFATSALKVKTAFPMWQQNALFREHALGHFPTLLKAVSRDPAMMVYLDLQQSNKDHPNENWSREVMELFTLGIENYTEQDVKESERLHRLPDQSAKSKVPLRGRSAWREVVGQHLDAAFPHNFANYLLNGTDGNENAPEALRRDPVDLTQIVPEDQRRDPQALLALLARRLYQAPLAPRQTETLLAYLKAQGGKTNNRTLRHVLHLMMSTPQFNLLNGSRSDNCSFFLR